jgi:hypothetical protein
MGHFTWLPSYTAMCVPREAVTAFSRFLQGFSGESPTPGCLVLIEVF